MNKQSFEKLVVSMEQHEEIRRGKRGRQACSHRRRLLDVNGTVGCAGG